MVLQEFIVYNEEISTNHFFFFCRGLIVFVLQYWPRQCKYCKGYKPFRVFASVFIVPHRNLINTLSGYTFGTPFDGGKKKLMLVHLFNSSESFSIKQKIKGGERKV